MESNFSFLQTDFVTMFHTARKAEQYVFADPLYCAILSRKSLEEFLKWLYENDIDLELPADTTLNSLLHETSFQQFIPKILFRTSTL